MLQPAYFYISIPFPHRLVHCVCIFRMFALATQNFCRVFYLSMLAKKGPTFVVNSIEKVSSCLQREFVRCISELRGKMICSVSRHVEMEKRNKPAKSHYHSRRVSIPGVKVSPVEFTLPTKWRNSRKTSRI